MKAQGMCAERSPDAISATCGKASLEPLHQTLRARPLKGGVFHRRALPPPVVRRQAAASASCAIDRRREQVLRKTPAAANGQESKIRAREIRTSGATAGQPSAPLRPCRPSVLRRWSAVHLRALRRRDRTPLPRRGRAHNHPRPPAQRREEVARYREAAASAKSSGSPPTNGP